MTPPVSAQFDSARLSAAIPSLVEFGRRTTAEQCVTSMGMILQDAQTETPAVSIGRMDAELDAPADIESLANLGYTKGDEIVMARASEKSNYNRLTGGRWRINLPKTSNIAGFARAYGKENAAQMFLQTVLQPIKERMRRARHSSGHFLQAGYIAARDFCVSSPLFKNRFRQRSDLKSPNPLNHMDPRQLGDATMTPPTGPEFQIVAMNNVGDRVGQGNSILDAEHRRALIEYSGPPLQAALDREAIACETELARRMAEGMPKMNKMLS
jgi:hypothetical protein